MIGIVNYIFLVIFYLFFTLVVNIQCCHNIVGALIRRRSASILRGKALKLAILQMIQGSNPSPCRASFLGFAG